MSELLILNFFHIILYVWYSKRSVAREEMWDSPLLGSGLNNTLLEHRNHDVWMCDSHVVTTAVMSHDGEYFPAHALKGRGR